MISFEDKYDVEKILDKRKKRGKWEYLVKWEGYDEVEATWEPVETLSKDVPDIVNKYEIEKNLKIPFHHERPKQNEDWISLQAALDELDIQFNIYTDCDPDDRKTYLKLFREKGNNIEKRML